MSRKKVSSNIYEASLQRCAAVKSIDPKLDLGNGISVVDYEKEIETLREEMEAYNTLLSRVDEQMARFHEQEKRVADFSERVLLGVGMAYGKNSTEYTKAGGTKKSEIKRKSSAEKPTK